MPRLPCKFHAMGRCSAGDGCRFSHAPGRGVAPQSIKAPCRYFAQGLCGDGRQCPFLHAAAPAPVAAPAPAPVAAPARAPAPAASVEEQRARQMVADIVAEAGGEAEEEEEEGKWDAVEVPWGSGEDADGGAYFFGVPGALAAPDAPPPVPGAGEYAKLSKQLRSAPAPASASASASASAFASATTRGSAADRRRVCRYFELGTCRNGSGCRWRHPGDLPSAEDLAEEYALAESERTASADVECGICFERVLQTTDKRFGMLTGCAHPFCLSCIRSWRSVEDGEQAPSQLRACPLCRQETFFVIPCDRYVTDAARKAEIVAKYRASAGKIPCRNFDQGRGDCPFGSSCHYAHFLPDGSAPRTKEDVDGNAKVVEPVQLSDFFSGRPAGGRSYGRR